MSSCQCVEVGEELTVSSSQCVEVGEELTVSSSQCVEVGEELTVSSSQCVEVGEELTVLFVCWLLNMLVYLKDGSAQAILRAATLRQKLQIQLSTSPSHSILTPGRPVPALTL